LLFGNAGPAGAGVIYNWVPIASVWQGGVAGIKTSIGQAETCLADFLRETRFNPRAATKLPHRLV
jgi:hypothetical protein